VQAIDADIVTARIHAVATDIRICRRSWHAIFLGVIKASQPLSRQVLPLVVDPVMVATSGDRLRNQRPNRAYGKIIHWPQ
jgi:hydroxymethylpyrimidine/phosphomethylpyrimidine kinase